MKRILVWMVAVLLVGGVAMAQGSRRGGERMDPKTRAQHMTERMTKEYALDENQQKQLLEVNLAWAEKMSANQGVRAKGDQASKPTKEEREKRIAEMEKSREDYETQLKAILTDKQYSSYEKNQAERGKRMGERAQNRQRGER